MAELFPIFSEPGRAIIPCAKSRYDLVRSLMILQVSARFAKMDNLQSLILQNLE
jgi:hypothetical protein